jgi:hypothetical protein
MYLIDDTREAMGVKMRGIEIVPTGSTTGQASARPGNAEFYESSWLLTTRR